MVAIWECHVEEIYRLRNRNVRIYLFCITFTMRQVYFPENRASSVCIQQNRVGNVELGNTLASGVFWGLPYFTEGVYNIFNIMFINYPNVIVL